MNAQPTVRRPGRFNAIGGRYRAAAGGAAVALILGGGIALQARPLLERPVAPAAAVGRAGAASLALPRVADRREEATANGSPFPRLADPWYAEAATGPAFPAVADRWFDAPTSVTAPG